MEKDKDREIDWKIYYKKLPESIMEGGKFPDLQGMSHPLRRVNGSVDESVV
jgi:hypothetical protein